MGEREEGCVVCGREREGVCSLWEGECVLCGREKGGVCGVWEGERRGV